MTIEDIKGVKNKRKQVITNSFYLTTIQRDYSKKIGVLSAEQFRLVIQEVNKAIIERLLSGKDFVIPFGLGSIGLRKSKRGVSRKNGKIFNNYPVDWESTLKLWTEDEESRNEKFLVKTITPEVYRLKYFRGRCKIKNKLFYRFRTNRPLKLLIKKKIQDGILKDALLYKNYET